MTKFKLVLMTVFALCLSLSGVLCGQGAKSDDWRIFFEDDFKRKELGSKWSVIDGNCEVKDNFLSGKGSVISTTVTKPEESPGFQRIEFELLSEVKTASENNLRCFFFAADDSSKKPLLTGYSFFFGDNNKLILYRKSEELSKVDFILEPGRKYKVLLENLYGTIRCVIDGKTVIDLKDKMAIFGKEHDRVGFSFASPAKVYNLKVYVKRLPNNLDLDF